MLKAIDVVIVASFSSIPGRSSWPRGAAYFILFCERDHVGQKSLCIKAERAISQTLFYRSVAHAQVVCALDAKDGLRMRDRACKDIS